MSAIPKKLEGIQAARAVAACGVVACHLLGYETKYLQGPPVDLPICQYGMAGVDLYFVISGFIITTMCQGRFGQPGEARRFLVQRAVRIYPIYWTWCIAVLVVFVLRPDMVNSSHGRPDALRSLLLLPQPNLPLLLVSWTLVYEMFFYLLFAAALRWIQSADLTRVLAAWALLVIVGHRVLAPTEEQPVLNLVFSPLLLEFVLGCMVALHMARLGWGEAFGSLAIGLAGFALGIAVLGAGGAPFPLGSGWSATVAARRRGRWLRWAMRPIRFTCRTCR